MKVRSSILVLLAFWLISSPVHAQTLVCPKPSSQPEANKSEGRRYFTMGNTHYKMAEYRESAAAFACVLQLVPYSLKARFLLALSYEKLKRYSLARVQYEWLLADTSEEAQALHPDVRMRVTGIRGKADAPAPEPAPPAPAGGRNLSSQWWFWTSVGAVALFTGVATFTGLQALEYRDRWERDWHTSDRDALDRYKDLTDLALGGVVLSAAALGLTMYLTREKPAMTPGVAPASASGRVLFLPACGAEGCMLTFSIGF